MKRKERLEWGGHWEVDSAGYPHWITDCPPGEAAGIPATRVRGKIRPDPNRRRDAAQAKMVASVDLHRRGTTREKVRARKERQEDEFERRRLEPDVPVKVNPNWQPWLRDGLQKAVDEHLRKKK